MLPQAAIIPGVPLGLIGAWAINRLLESVLFGVRPNRPVTLIMAAAAVAAIALLATWQPALTASRDDLHVTLQSDAWKLRQCPFSGKAPEYFPCCPCCDPAFSGNFRLGTSGARAGRSRMPGVATRTRLKPRNTRNTQKNTRRCHTSQGNALSDAAFRELLRSNTHGCSDSDISCISYYFLATPLQPGKKFSPRRREDAKTQM